MITLGEHIEIEYRAINGNHDRIEPVKSASTEENNYGHLLLWYLDTVFKDINHINVIHSNLTSNMHEIKMFDYYIGMEHGDLGKINECVQNWTSMYKKQYREIYRGHLHHKYAMEENGTYIEHFPSLCGCDAYATSLRKVSDPEVSLIIYNEKGRYLEHFVNLK